MGDRKSLTLAEGMVGMSENVFINIKNRSLTLTADVVIPEGTVANGIIICQGGRFGGWAMYFKDGVPAYDYNFLGISRYTVQGKEKLKPGKYSVKFEFVYDGGGPGKGGTGTISVNGVQAGTARIDRTQPGIFSADETADVGIDLATPVVERVGAERRSKFNGRIPRVVVEVI